MTLAAMFAVTLPLAAQDKSEKSPAQELIELVSPVETMKQTAMLAFKPAIDNLKAQGIPEQGIQEIVKAADHFFTTVMSDPGMQKELASIYEKEFTADEIKELLLFYKTPLGRKTLEKMPQLMQQGGKLGEKYAQKHMNGFQQEIQAIIKKHLKPPVAPEG